MRIQGAVVLAIVFAAAMAQVWGSSDEWNTWRGEMPQVSPENPTEQAVRVSGLHERALPMGEVLRQGEVLDVLATSRHSLMDSVRRLAHTRSFAAQVGAAASQSPIMVASVVQPLDESRILEVSTEGEEWVDACPEAEWKLAALTAYNVEWAYQVGLIVEYRESSCRVNPCVVGAAGERGPFQFMPGTWAGTPYAEYDRCDPIAAWRAFAWMLSLDPENGPRHWTTWPR